MDSEVIREISSQMGMAADTTAQFLSDILPQYAIMKIMGEFGWITFSLVVIAASIVIARYNYKESLKPIPDGLNALDVLEANQKIEEHKIGTIVSIVFVFLGFGFLIAGLIPAFQWAIVPDAMFMHEVISRIGR